MSTCQQSQQPAEPCWGGREGACGFTSLPRQDVAPHEADGSRGAGWDDGAAPQAAGRCVWACAHLVPRARVMRQRVSPRALMLLTGSSLESGVSPAHAIPQSRRHSQSTEGQTILCGRCRSSSLVPTACGCLELHLRICERFLFAWLSLATPPERTCKVPSLVGRHPS